MLKQSLSFSIVAVAILVILVGYYFYNQKPEYDIRHFNGLVIGVESDVVNLSGSYGSDAILPKDLTEKRDFKFKTSAQTQFKKIETRTPTVAELREKGLLVGNIAKYDPAEFSTESVGSLEDLKNSLAKGDIIAVVDFSSSIYKVENPIASKIVYRVIFGPPKTTTSNQ